MALLTDKQKRFCEEYIIDLNGTQAAIRTGYSKKTANEQAARLLANVSIQKYISELRQNQMDKAELSAAMIINELKALGFWSIRDFIDTDNTIKDLSKMDKALLKPVVGLKVTETVINEKTKEVRTEIKFADKRGALVDLGRHLGIFKEDNEQQAIKIHVTRK